MSRGSNLWKRWKVLAHKAAVVQSNVLLWLLFYIVFVPLALVRRPFSDPLALRALQPRWRERRGTPQDLEAARQQF